MIRLRIQTKGESEERIFQGSEVVIGRSTDCDITVKGVGYLSRQHCRLEIVEGRCVVSDLSSKNGLQVNGIFFKRGIVEVGDEIRMGEILTELVEFGPDEVGSEEVRPCIDCGYLISADESNCPQCSGGGLPRKRHKIDPEHIPGYRLIRRIGSGGMGIVFEAVRKEDQATTALKILRPHLARDPSYLVRFVEETRVLTMLKHPNIVQIYGRGSDNGLTYIDMELVRGDSVRRLIRRKGRIGEAQAVDIVWNIVLALDFAANKRVIHGDVKPSNFLIHESGAVKLCDFGLARFFNLASVLSSVRFAPESATGRKGTAAYAAPERFRPRAKPTVPGDIYSMGVSLFQMLTGELPFGTNKEARHSVARESIPDPTLYNSEIRSSTCMLIDRMMRYDSSERYQSYRELQDDLAILLG